MEIESKYDIEANERQLRSLWDREYGELNVIPSSLRPSPSKALLLYESLIDFSRLTPVLDVGCGNGRNAIYLAGKGCKVNAVDSSEVALRHARERIQEAKLANKVRFQDLVLRERWPFPDNHFALALDSYVFCHILDNREQEEYRRELRRVLQPSGIVYSSVFCVDDEYYRELIDVRDSGNRIVLDPRNGIRKSLYTEDEFQGFFSVEFRIKYFAKFQFDDIALGRKYRRSILTLILER